jgi:c-di-GMP-binding flagellar brake protein YcgR
MNRDFEERRRHIRVYFATLDEMECEFSNGAGAVKVSSASVLDLSLGGIHLAVDAPCDCAVGDRVTLSRLNHRTGPVSDEEIPVEIRWVFAPEDLSRFYMGCRFLELPNESRRGIANLINVKLLEASSARIENHRR